MTKTTRSIRVIHTTIRPERRINCENNKSIHCNSSTKSHSNHRSLTQSFQKNISPYNNSEKQSSLPDLSSDLSTSSKQQFNINVSDYHPSSSETKISRFQTDRKGTIKDMWKESNKNKRRKYFPHSCGHRLYLCIFISICCTLLIAIGIAAISVGLLIKTSKPSTTTTTTTTTLLTTTLINLHRKIALVIGISEYKINKSLPNAINDANGMSKMLKSMGFLIHDGEAKLNLTRKDFKLILTAFIESIEDKDIVLFYYAGHGTQWEDQNYLIPSDDFKVENNENIQLTGPDLKKYAINAQTLLNNIDDRDPFLTIFLLDCCRTYHLGHIESEKNKRGDVTNRSKGLSLMPPKIGSLIAFACAPGRDADDGNNGEKNGLFTKYLLQHLSTPNEDIEILLRRVRNNVMEESEDEQIPHVTSVLRYDHICLFNGKKDQHGFLYVSDLEKNEVRKWKLEKINKNKEGILVAGGNGKGNQRNQLNSPTFIFVDKDQSLYVSDRENHRVMKWRKDANEGVVMAGGNGEGNSLNQLNQPEGLFVDEWNQIYMADCANHRIMRWCEGDEEGSIVVGGNDWGSESNQFNGPVGLSFDFEGNLYVSDSWNARIVRFDLIRE
ncbi:hypothetical protein I4U23_011706 [Adineta vaga]|nr:hypothetical protein I4U23_011706 [Adineta vaga]